VQPMSDRLTRANSASFGQTGQQSAGTPDLFAYGTLAVDDVIGMLLDRVPVFDEVSAPGWRSARLSGLLYPGLIASADDVAFGRLYTGLTRAEWAILDAFEDPGYVLVEVHLVPTHRAALAYVWPGDTDDTVWHYDSVTEGDRAEYLARCGRWRRAYDSDAYAPRTAERRNCRRR
jgi:gamma-glutamylcyclotransferase (GGCT)/AIG2-like uncharacterized protein YtfP